MLIGTEGYIHYICAGGQSWFWSDVLLSALVRL